MPSSDAPQFAAMQAIQGTHWAPGEGPSPTLGGWLRTIGSTYQDMASYANSVMQMEYFEWCGLTVGYCMTKAGIRPVFGSRDADRFLWALAWLEWGDAVQVPEQGDVVVFDFGGGAHHVSLFDSDAGSGYWFCLGGNQSHEVKLTKFPRSSVKGVRRAAQTRIATHRMADLRLGEVGLAEVSRALVSPRSAASVFVGSGKPLTETGLAQAAQRLGVGVAEIWALTFTETDPPYGGFYADKRPQVLFERHVFHRLTGGRFDAAYPDISNSRPGGYGAGGSHQYDRISLAMSLDESAALQSASWGIGQVLGENYTSANCASPQDLVARAFSSEDEQLASVANEVVADGAARALATHDWATFARIYNGPNYAQNNYDNVLRSWYEKVNNGALPDLRIRAAQLYLMYLGYPPQAIDGLWGKHTKSAMNEFQAAKGLPITDVLDDATSQAIETAGAAVHGAQLTASHA